MPRCRDKFLREQKLLRLATVGPDGTPHVAPVWYVYSGGRFHIGTNTRTRKARNLRGNSRAAFCIDVGINAPDIDGVAGSGRARLILDKAGVRRIARRILLRYYDTIDDAAAQELLDDTDCIIELTPDRFVKWSF